MQNFANVAEPLWTTAGENGPPGDEADPVIKQLLEN